jgi:acyl carrier protein
MADTEERLRRCFSAVFPNLAAEQITNASPLTVAAWDSVASVTVFALVEEEFALEIDVQDMKNLLSFVSLRGYLDERIGKSAA